MKPRSLAPALELAADQGAPRQAPSEADLVPLALRLGELLEQAGIVSPGCSPCARRLVPIVQALLTHHATPKRTIP